MAGYVLCWFRSISEMSPSFCEVELRERGEFVPEPLAFLVDEWRVSCAAIETDPQGVQVWSHELLEHPLPARRVLNGVRKNPGEATHDAIDVTRGLATGEPVVVAGEHRVRDGSRVLVESPIPTEARLERAGGAQ